MQLFGRGTTSVCKAQPGTLGSISVPSPTNGHEAKITGQRRGSADDGELS